MKKDKNDPPFGLEIVDDIPWGTHLCQFYESKRDLIEILVPYFAEGLRHNEYCLWITSPSFGSMEGRRALKAAIPDLDKFISRDQISIISQNEWHRKFGEFKIENALQTWKEKTEQAIRQGFQGMRLASDTSLFKPSSKNLEVYESTLDATVRDRRMVALCTHSLKKAKAPSVVEAIRNHAGTIVRKDNSWTLVGYLPNPPKTYDSSGMGEKNSEAVLEKVGEGIWVVDDKNVTTYVNPQLTKMLGYSASEMIGKHLFEFMDSKGIANVSRAKWLRRGNAQNQVEQEFIHKNGKKMYALVTTVMPLRNKEGKRTGTIAGLIDITEQKRVTSALLASEHRYRSLFTSMRNAYVYTKVLSDSKGNTKDFIILSCNDAFRILMQVEDEIILGKRASEVLRWDIDELSKWITNLGEVAATGKSMTFNSYQMTLSKWLSVSAYSPETGYVVSIIEDVTERKGLEERLFQSEKRYRTLYETMLDGVVFMDMSGKIVECNEAYTMILGYSREELKKLRYQQLTPGKWRKVEEDVLNEQILPRGFSDVYEKEYVRKDGTQIPVEIRRWLIKDDQGKPTGIWGIIRDVTERKAVEEALRRSELRYRTLVEPNIIGISLADNERIIEANEAFLKLVGYTRADLEKGEIRWREMTPPEYLPLDEMGLKEMHSKGSCTPYEKEYIRKDRSRVPILIGSAMLQRKPIQWVCFVMDITERRRAEAELNRYTRNLEKLVEERTQKMIQMENLATIGRVAGMVGHDIRNPLQAIQGTVFLAKEELKLLEALKSEKTPIMKEMLKIIEDEADYIDKIVTDLQDYARTVVPKFERRDLEELLESSLSRIMIPENIQVTILVEPPGMAANVDAVMTRRILTNLITNAVQAMANGGKLSLKAQGTEKSIYVHVEDTGTGIPEDIKPKIFTPLFSTKAKGQGFGLAVCKRLAEAQNHQIRFESEVGKGSTFTLIIPL